MSASRFPLASLLLLSLSLAPVFAIAAPDSSPAAGIRPPDAVDEMAQNLQPTREFVYKKSGTRDLHLYVFDPPGWKPGDRRSCFLTIHGGGWSGLSPRRQFPVADYFATRGMVAISVEYRLAQKGSGTDIFDCVKDARSALRYARSHAAELGIDPQRIVANGGSAGGHLAAGTALFGDLAEPGEDGAVSCIPNALVLFFPVIDTSEAGYGQARIGARWKEISPLHQVRPGAPPTLLFHGTGDTVTPFAGAKAFDEAMRAAGNRCELITHEGGIHGYLMRDKKLFDQTMARTAEFLASLHLLDNAQP